MQSLIYLVEQAHGVQVGLGLTEGDGLGLGGGDTVGDALGDTVGVTVGVGVDGVGDGVRVGDGLAVLTTSFTCSSFDCSPLAEIVMSPV